MTPSLTTEFGLLLAFVACVFVPAVSAQSTATDRPNVLLIASDDQGYNDLGVLNKEIITPNLDRLAREGTRLSSLLRDVASMHAITGWFFDGTFSTPQWNRRHDSK